MKRLTLTSLLTLAVLMGCSSSEQAVPDVLPSLLYQEATTALEDARWLTAIEKLEALDSRYPFGPYSEQVQFDLIFAYYKNADYALAGATIDRFLRMYPGNRKTDWVIYMRGLTNMAQDESIIHNMLNIERSDRDPEPAKRAFTDFRQLLETFPHSQYANDAKYRMVALKNRLADYELATADFYARREAWVAVINRGKELLRDYSDTQAAKQVLPLMVQAYQNLNLPELAANTQALIEANKFN